MWRPSRLAPDQRDGARVARWITIGGTVVFLLVITQGRPWELFARAKFSGDFYDEQARSLLRGRLDVRPETVLFEGFLIDGRTYLYYGPLLAVARLPAAVFGDLLFGRLTRLSLVAGYVVWCTAAFRLLLAARPSGQPGRAQRWQVGIFMAAVAASPMLFLASWVSVYHETEVWAAAFVLGAVAAAVAWTRHPTARRGALAAAWAAAALLTRFPVGVGAALAVGVAAVVVGRSRPRTVFPAAAIVAGAAATHVLFNVAKFGSLLHLPADRQVLSLNDPERAAWFAGNGNSFFGVRFVPTTLAHYLRPDTVAFERLVPFIRFGRPAVDYADYPLETTQPAASLTATAIALIVLAVIGLVVMIRRRHWLWLGFTGAVVVGAVPTVMIGFIANRYLADLLPMLVVPAATGAWAVPIPADGTARRMVAIGAGVVLAWGLWSNVALAMWGQNLKEPWFTEMRYRVDRAVFGDGQVAVADNCAGVYIAEQGHWVALERTPGLRTLSGTVEVDGGSEAPLATGPGWELRLVESGNGTARVDYAGPPGERAGQPVDVAGPTAEVAIVADPTTGELSVTLDGEVTQFALGSPDDGPIEPGPDLTVTETAAGPLCDLLAPASVLQMSPDRATSEGQNRD